MEKLIFSLNQSLSKSISMNIKDLNNIAILFSGGLDSSLLAYLVKLQIKDNNVTLYTVCTTESQDLFNSESAAKLLGLKLEKIKIDSEDLKSAISDLANIIESSHPVKISYELPLFLGLAKIEEKCVLTGQGADELFGGYARYLKMKENELEDALNSDVKTLIKQEIKMDYKIAKHFKKDLKTPYLYEDVVKCAQNIPIKYKVFNGERKIILKETALSLGLPKELVLRQKKAAQYSSGIIKELRKMAKRKKISVNELINELFHK
jgi:asparagine synthase (glutamine-hydrolysing)